MAPSSRGSVRWTRPRQRTRTGPASVISFGSVRRISTGEPSRTSLERKKYTPRELTSRDSVLVSPTAAPVVHRTVSGSRMENRWVVRRSEPVKADLPNERLSLSASLPENNRTGDTKIFPVEKVPTYYNLLFSYPLCRDT